LRNPPPRPAIATFALLVAASLGAYTLQDWGVSVGALLVTGGTVLFLVALQPVLGQFRPREPRAEAPEAAAAPPPVSALAFSPLAFPTIVTPYGIAVLVLLLTLEGDVSGDLRILGVLALVLVLDVLAMSGADWVMRAVRLHCVRHSGVRDGGAPARPGRAGRRRGFACPARRGGRQRMTTKRLFRALIR
jgi:small neutral amino acid transporter SnatA (MarC family)